jgi:hypothetical protein
MSQVISEVDNSDSEHAVVFFGRQRGQVENKALPRSARAGHSRITPPTAVFNLCSSDICNTVVLKMYIKLCNCTLSRDLTCVFFACAVLEAKRW